MGLLTLPHTIDAGTEIVSAEHQANYVAIRDVINGNLDTDNIDSGVLEDIGVSETGTVRRGKAVIATEEARANTAYGLMTTPDQVSSIVVPADGLLFVSYRGMIKESVQGAAAAAVFIGANQVKQVDVFAAPVVAEWTSVTSLGIDDSGANVYGLLEGPGTNGEFSLRQRTAGNAYSGDVTTGMPQPFAAFFVAAGTYNVSVQFKASSGSVTVKNRALRVWTMGF
jgi:hypothetical protein